MALNNFSFMIFFILVLAVMFILQILRRRSGSFSNLQKALLLVFSYAFIMLSDWRSCVVIALYSLFVYAVGYKVKGNRKLLILTIAVSVAALAYFKYTNFLLEGVSGLLGISDPVILRIILPLGISFYIFTGLSYVIDVYRGNWSTEKSVIDVLLYLSFFPKVISGPIVRPHTFFPQAKKYRGLEWKAFRAGIQIFVFGLFKKMVIADHLGVFVDDVFAAPAAYDTVSVIWAVISYSMQIYFDFSGYSDMALGLSKILGFDLEPNFDLPYTADGISDFWKRWHISLSSWLRDYLYFPLGGSRKGKGRTYVNLIIVMTVSGLWHGAGWTFILWGFLHGLLSCLEKIFGKFRSRVPKGIRIVVTYIMVANLWVFFRADSIRNALDVLTGMYTMHTGIFQPYTWTGFAVTVLLIATVMAWRRSHKNSEGHVNGYYPILNLGSIWQLALFLFVCGVTVIMGYYGDTAFIYGAF